MTKHFSERISQSYYLVNIVCSFSSETGEYSMIHTFVAGYFYLSTLLSTMQIYIS